jgi:hypothetical protein
VRTKLLKFKPNILDEAGPCGGSGSQFCRAVMLSTSVRSGFDPFHPVFISSKVSRFPGDPGFYVRRCKQTSYCIMDNTKI